MIEVEVRENDMNLTRAVEQTSICNKPPGTGAHVEKQGSLAVTHEYAARLANAGRRAAAAAEYRYAHVPRLSLREIGRGAWVAPAHPWNATRTEPIS